jgi:hypothetical protein
MGSRLRPSKQSYQLSVEFPVILGNGAVYKIPDRLTILNDIFTIIPNSWFFAKLNTNLCLKIKSMGFRKTSIDFINKIRRYFH